MGGFFSRFFTKDYRILMLGLDSAGKTTMLYKLKLDEYLTTIPTIGFNVENIQYKNINLTVWDIGGQDKIRSLWRHYFDNSDALIFIIDSTDVSRFPEANEELFKICTDRSMTTISCVLIFWNKTDMPTSISVKDFHKHFTIDYIKAKLLVQPCSALNGNGLNNGILQMLSVLK